MINLWINKNVKESQKRLLTESKKYKNPKNIINDIQRRAEKQMKAENLHIREAGTGINYSLTMKWSIKQSHLCVYNAEKKAYTGHVGLIHPEHKH